MSNIPSNVPSSSRQNNTIPLLQRFRQCANYACKAMSDLISSLTICSTTSATAVRETNPTNSNISISSINVTGSKVDSKQFSTEASKKIDSLCANLEEKCQNKPQVTPKKLKQIVKEFKYAANLAFFEKFTFVIDDNFLTDPMAYNSKALLNYIKTKNSEHDNTGRIGNEEVDFFLDYNTMFIEHEQNSIASLTNSEFFSETSYDSISDLSDLEKFKYICDSHIKAKSAVFEDKNLLYRPLNIEEKLLKKFEGLIKSAMEDKLNVESTKKSLDTIKKAVTSFVGNSLAGSDFLPYEPFNDVELDEGELMKLLDNTFNTFLDNTRVDDQSLSDILSSVTNNTLANGSNEATL